MSALTARPASHADSRPPVSGKLQVQYDYSDPALPGGTLLYGQLWTGPGIQDGVGRDVLPCASRVSKNSSSTTFTSAQGRSSRRPWKHLDVTKE